jgi:hypothetical protein
MAHCTANAYERIVELKIELELHYREYVRALRRTARHDDVAQGSTRNTRFFFHSGHKNELRYIPCRKGIVLGR